MDRIEDEVEAHAYEDLVPLDVKLALEDRVFGWTHFTSSFFGHVAFTFGSYTIVYEIVTFCITEFCEFRGTSIPVYWEFIRTVLALWAAISTYRMVRRRRSIWFRSPYGSKAYKEDEQRRMQTVKETDKSTTLGKMMQSFRHRRVLKRLRKAEIMFAKKHSNTIKLRKKFVGLSTPEASSSDDDSSDGNNSFASSSTGTPASNTAMEPILRSPSFHTKPTNRM
jgi:hypothetical protein